MGHVLHILEEDREVNCWTPSQFMEAHVEYANHICQYEDHRHPIPPPVNYTDRPAGIHVLRNVVRRLN